MLQTCIRQVPDSNLGRAAWYPYVFRVSPHSVQANSGIVIELGHGSFLLYPYLLIIHDCLPTSFDAIKALQLKQPH
jgi:hypothetical protein